MRYVIFFIVGLALLLSNVGLSAKSKDNISPIGYWEKDAVGLPCFHYTGSLPAMGVKPDGGKAKIPDDPWFLLGNYQLTLFAHVSGKYELITGQRAWGRMNQGEEINSGENNSVLTMLDGSGKAKNSICLVGMDSEALRADVCRKTFGCEFAHQEHRKGESLVET